MGNEKTIILGAGIAGISAGYHLSLKGIESTVYEQDADWGGLCGNFMVDGFRFDKSVHLHFSSSQYVLDLFEKSAPFRFLKPISSNYYKGHWVKHPAQNNLAPLPTEEKVSIITDFIKNKTKEHTIDNYESWLRAQYGDYFSENFPMRYTRKYWSVEAKELSTTWIGPRMYQPDIEEVLRGSYTTDTPNTYYVEEFRYPQKGGFKSYLNLMAKECDIQLNKKAHSIDVKTKEVEFADGTLASYDNLVSSVPLPDLVACIKDAPKEVVAASENLFATSVAIVSLGFNKTDIPKYLWYYIYDEDFLPARCHSPSIKSPDNVPEGCSSVQFEVYFSHKNGLAKNGDELIEHVLDKGIEMGLFKMEDVVVKDARVLPYGNVVFYQGMEDDRKIVQDYLDSVNIHYIGRFGKWGYLWTDASLLSGKELDLNANL